MYYEPRKEALLEAKRYRVAYNKDGSVSKRPNVTVVCAHCKQEFKEKEINIDHIEPVGETPEWPPNDVKDWGMWMARLNCRVENFQALCTKCHATKTVKDREEMRRVQALRRNSPAAPGDSE